MGSTFLILPADSRSNEIDDFYAGETEETPALSLPSSGEFSIEISGFDDSAGNYRLTLYRLMYVPGTDSLAYAQVVDSVDGRVSTGVASRWPFNGTEGDSIKIIVGPDEELDAVIDVVDSTGKSILSEDIQPPNYTIVLGYLYVLVLGLAVIKGFWSLLRKPKKNP